MSEGNIIGVLARVYVDDLDRALPLYERLTGDGSPLRFGHEGVLLAKVGVFLLIQGATREARTHAATVNARDITKVVDAVTSSGGTLLEGPAPGPNGTRLVVRHPDGNVIEYVELHDGEWDGRRGGGWAPGIGATMNRGPSRLQTSR